MSDFLLLFLIIFLATAWPILAFGLTSCTSPPPSAEVLALQELYNTTGGAQWINKWDSSLSNPCLGSYGVTCDDISNICHVTQLSLSSNNLVGTLPSSLGSLSQLRSLQLNNNTITGELPTSVWSLENILTVDLSQNSMSGQISSSIDGLLQLTELSLSANNFSGPIPESLGSLTRLVQLDLSRNQFAYEIPESLGNLTNLVTLQLSFNALTGMIPSSFGNMSRLMKLTLSRNHLIGTVPSSFSVLVNMTELDISINKLSGPFPEAVIDMVSLVALRLHHNQLTGTLPLNLSKLTKLKELDLSSNNFVGSIPPSVGLLSDLSQLVLYSNELAGTIPSSIEMLTNLTYLNLDSNSLEGLFPMELIGLPQLKALILANNKFSGTIPSTIANLTKLTILYMDANKFTGSIPSTIGGMTRLETLDLSWNNLTGRIPPSLGNLSRLMVLDVGANRLTGKIPPSLYRLSELHGFYLYDNHLTGSISSSIGQMKKLNGIHFHGNSLSGSLPLSISALSGLVSLVLSGNHLTGTIPPSIFELPRLAVIYLDQNRLNGSVPSTIGTPRALGGIFLYSNWLTGSIPASIGNLPVLVELLLFSNDLTGTIPSNIASSPVLNELLLYSNKLNGTIPMLTRSGPTPNPFAIESADRFIGNQTGHGCHHSILYSCFLSNNSLTGPLPPCFESLSSLRYLGLENTYLTINGSQMFPADLEYLDISNIGLTDPQVVENILQQVYKYVDLSQNAFGGSLPASVWNASIQKLLLNNNQFHGSFPSPKSRSCTLNYLSISANRLTGTLPVELSLCENLTAFFATNMALSGPLKGRFGVQKRLQTVAIANNAFTGPVDDVFRASEVSNWILNAGYNALTGTLPVDRLMTGHFQSLMLLVNCMSGTLPAEALCKNANMSELLLSGLHSARACRPLFLPAWSGGWTYIESNTVRGSIPSCLLSPALSQMTYLALSGNLFSGTIDDDVMVSDTLIGVDLSHNALTGPIPRALLEAELQLLDLSFNRFSGTVSDTATSYYATTEHAQVSLEVNMLSGTLPTSWVEANNIDVLNGNMFACSSQQPFVTANEPVNDHLAATYACGSSLTNLSLLIFFLAMVMAFLLLFIGRPLKNGSQVVDRAQTELTRLLVTCQSLVGVNRWRNACGMFAFLTVSLMVYSIMNVLTSAYAEQYIWVLSLSLQQGTVVGSVLLIWFFVVCMWVHYRAEADAAYVGQYSFSIRRYSRQMASRQGTTVAVSWLTAFSVFFALLGTHVVPVFVVNIVYVYTTTLSLPVWIRSIIVASMSLFKLSWNTLMHEWLSNRYLPVHVATPLADEVFVDTMLLYASVISLIVVPVLTEMLVSPNCFQYMFTPISTDSYDVQGNTCYWIMYTHNIVVNTVDVACMSYADLQATYNSGSEATATGNYNMMILSTSTNGEASAVSFTAGFAYNFQCTLSLLESFVFIFVYKYVWRLVMLQGLWIALKKSQTYLYNRYGPSSYWFRHINDWSPFLMRLIDDEDVDVGTKYRRDEVITYNVTLLHRWHREKHCDRAAKRLKMRVISDLAIALSFGLLFPLLGMLALIGVVVDLMLTHRMLDRLRRYAERMRGAPVISNSVDKTADKVESKVADKVAHKVDQGEDNDDQMTQRTTIDDRMSPTMSNDEYADLVLRLVDEMGVACTQHLQDIQQIQPMLLYFAALVWALGLYDIVGRQTGSLMALWIFFMTLTMPIWTSYLGLHCFRYSRPLMKRADTPSVDVDIEMMTEVR